MESELINKKNDVAPKRPTIGQSERGKKRREQRRRARVNNAFDRLYSQGQQQLKRRDRITRSGTPPVECTFTPITTEMRKATGRSNNRKAVKDTLDSIVDAIASLGTDQKSRTLH